MRFLRLAMSVAMSVAFAGSFCLASAQAADTPQAQPATAAGPSSQPQASGAMQIYITAVSGLVQVRDGQGQPWRIAAPQMLISEGAELRTGPHSSVTCVIPPDQTFTLDRLGTVRVEEAARHGNKITTDLIMKYGRTHYDIEAAGLEHEASIISPSSTLAVRGTNVTLFDQPPFKPEAISYTGRASFLYNRATVSVGKKNGAFARALAGTNGAADTALNETVIDPRYAPSLSSADQSLLASEVARGAVLSYDPIANIPVVTGGRPQYDSELPAGLPGSLDFVLRWTGNADLNLEVGLDKGDPLINILNGFQQGEFLYPGYGYQNSPSGGHIPYDDRGGPTGGQEIAYWTGSFPSGLYGIAAQSISGAATSFTVGVFANGVLVNEYYFASDGVSLIKSTQVTRTLQPGQLFSALVPIPPVGLLEQLTPDDPVGNPNPGIGPGSFNNAVQPAAVQPAAVQASTSVAHPAVKTAAQTSRYLPTKNGVLVRR
ncbi:MAG TPA: hypothetical protein VHX86_11455 [Tepidisphaeraceae bacterium]|jgi:hypothetical protein|nr:hypothetical protein [Tepidisphaeraceae bacterium]